MTSSSNTSPSLDDVTPIYNWVQLDVSQPQSNTGSILIFVVCFSLLVLVLVLL